MNRIALFGLFILSVPAVVIASPDSEWKGEVELGIVVTTGNTETENYNAKAKAVNERDKWKHTATFEGLSSSDDVSRTAERYFVSGKSAYKINNKSYIFGLVSYDDDNFGGYDYRTAETIGYGRNIIKKDELTLDLEAGVGARQTKLDDGTSNDEMIGRLAGELDWKISDSASLSEDLSFDIGEDQTISKSVTGLKAQINGSLSSKITYTVKNTSDVPVGVEETDTETAVTLVYSF